MQKAEAAWVDAGEAVAALGVSRATLYAYVSRGRIRSEPVPGDPRRRRYSRDDIERVLARTREQRTPEKAAEQALHWGLPILESAITLIADGRIYYRGRDAEELAQAASVEEVAALIWTGTTATRVSDMPRRAAMPKHAAARTHFIAHAQAALSIAATEDPLAFDLRPRSVAQTGWHILNLLAHVAAGGAPKTNTVDGRLATAWRVDRARSLIRAALILCADHELNVSAFTARCVASAGASPYGVVVAGLAALEGFKHGGTTARIEALWDSVADTPDIERALAERLKRGEPVDGFGHPLYPDGDPRAKIILAGLSESGATDRARGIASAARNVLGEHPNLDFALVTLARALDLPDGTALTLFAIGRTIGWIGQAIEQYAQDAVIRPRAKYIGEVPASP